MLSQVENNIVAPSIATLWIFAEALGVKDWLPFPGRRDRG